LTMFMLLLASATFAQNPVTGKVIGGKDKQPVPGATVTVKGSVAATQTDADGAFRINAPEKSTLVITAVGFTTQELTVGKQSNLIATLEETSTSLDEIVVTGYSAQKKKDLTGAVSVVNVDQMNKQPTASIADQMQGQAAGVTILGSGQPGEAPQFRIRGFNTFGNNSPLFVVDGVPTTNIADLNPNDISSLQVLKDAGAASIYGSRASNGVVIITTKKGKGKVKVSYNGYYGIQSPKSGNVFDVLTPQEQGDLKKLAIKNTADRSGTAPNFSDALYGNGATAVLPDYILPVGAMEGSAAVNPDLYNINPNYTSSAEYDAFYRITRANKTGTDWYHEIFKNAPIMSHDVNVAGGSEQGNYLLSFNYFNQQGTLIETYNKRYTVRANTSYNINKHIRFGENLAFSLQDNPRIAILDEGNPVSMAYRQHPIIPVRDIMGNYAGTFGPTGLGQATNPVAARERSINNKGLGSRIFGNVYGEVDLLKHFTFRSSFGGEYYSYNNRSFNYPTYENQENGQTNSYNEGMGNGYNWTWTNTVNYQQDFGDHNVKVVAGTEAFAAGGQDMSASARDYFSFDPNFTNLSTGASVNGAPGSGRYAESLYSLIGRLDYSYKGKYLVGATVRR
ncbi:MAG: SusC/RagA family TonB-linked outer membrane protein, partial [Chitinophagaceae bacterium]